MVRKVIEIAVMVWAVAGCASTMAPPTDPMLSQAQQCMRGGGWWRQSLGICDVQGTGPELGRH